jgi:hypothetical protein
MLVDRTITKDAYNHITQKPNGQCLDVEGYGTIDESLISTWPCHPEDKDPAHQNQGWKLNDDGSFITTLSSLCVDTSPPQAARSLVW